MRWTGVVAMSIALASGAAWGQAYPSRVIRYVVSDSPGSSLDALARIVADGLAATLQQSVVIDNRPGAGGNIGADVLARATPDGYTMGQIATTHAVNATLYRNLNYDLVRDFAPVTQLASIPSLAVVPPSSPAKTLADFIKLAKAKPGELTYASAGTGTCTFLAGELFKTQAGVDLLHVPYKGGPPAVTSVLAGETSVYFAPLSAALPQVRQGKLRALGISTPQRLPLVQEYPTIAEGGVPGYRFSCWYGLVVPAKTPPKIVSAIHAAVVKVLADPTTQKRLTDSGFIPVGDTPQEFGALIKSEIAAFRPLVKNLPQP